MLKTDFFIDKMNLHQDHDHQLLPSGSERIWTEDLSTGELTPNECKFQDSLEGSFSSKINIYVRENRVVVAGNPSRWNRSENLWGFRTIDECVQVYNRVLAKLDLPPFTKATKHWIRQGEDGSKAKVVTDGAVFDHFDFTKNHAVGQGREYSFLRGLASQSIGRGLDPFLYPNGATVDWGSSKSRAVGKGSTYRYDKMYIKHIDLEQHRDKRLQFATQDQIAYYDRIAEYCRDMGIVRQEQSKKRAFLDRNFNLRHYGFGTESDFESHLNDIDNALNRLEVNHMNYETISQQLIANGICKSTQAANSTQAYCMSWLHGERIDKKKSQYYVHRSRLLELGLDIAVPYDVSRMPPQVRSSEVIELRSVAPPEWYQMPTLDSRPQLRVVA